MTIPARAAELLRGGTLCYLAALTPRGPHVTPVVFVFEDGRLWATTARGTVKARAWRRQPVAAGLVGGDGEWLTFRGPVETYDLLDPTTWRAGMQRAAALARASVRFTMKNARFFAGYARDAHRIPLAWTPPGRVTVGVLPEAGAVLRDGEVVERWGSWGRRTGSVRALDDAPGALAEEPTELGGGGEGAGVLGLAGSDAPTVLPVTWHRLDGLGAYDIAVPRAYVTLAGAGARSEAALVIDRASSWRASEMLGLLLQGPAETHAPAAASRATIRLRPRRMVWWKGWRSGTVGRP